MHFEHFPILSFSSFRGHNFVNFLRKFTSRTSFEHLRPWPFYSCQQKRSFDLTTLQNGYWKKVRVYMPPTVFASFAICDSDFLMYISCFNLILSEFQINSNFKSISFCHSQVSLVSIAVFPKRLNCVQNF